MAVRVDRAESTRIRVSSHIVRLALEELYSWGSLKCFA